MRLSLFTAGSAAFLHHPFAFQGLRSRHWVLGPHLVPMFFQLVESHAYIRFLFFLGITTTIPLCKKSWGLQKKKKWNSIVQKTPKNLLRLVKGLLDQSQSIFFFSSFFRPSIRHGFSSSSSPARLWDVFLFRNSTRRKTAKRLGFSLEKQYSHLKIRLKIHLDTDGNPSRSTGQAA